MQTTENKQRTFKIEVWQAVLLLYVGVIGICVLGALLHATWPQGLNPSTLVMP